MTNKEKALALIGTFVTGDTAKAKELLATVLFSITWHLEQEQRHS